MMMICAHFLVLANVGVALREAAEASEDTSISVGEMNSNAEAALASLNLTEDFGTSKAFAVVGLVKVPPSNLTAFHKLEAETNEAFWNDLAECFLHLSLTSKTQPNMVSFVVVFADSKAFMKLTELQAFSKWFKVSTELGVEIEQVQFVGDTEFPPEVKKQLPPVSQFLPQSSGFAREPRKDGKVDNTWFVEFMFTVPNDKLPIMEPLNSAFIATQFDWDQNCFFARVCKTGENPSNGTSFTFFGVYTYGTRAVELGEGATEQQWLTTATKHGVTITGLNIYGTVSEAIKDSGTKWGGTFWDTESGFSRY